VVFVESAIGCWFALLVIEVSLPTTSSIFNISAKTSETVVPINMAGLPRWKLFVTDGTVTIERKKTIDVGN
jgi:hypothetical protein